MKQPAVFIDRDGTLSEEVGYLNHPSRLKLYSYSAEAIRLLNANLFLAIVVTNQSGVARGYFTEDLLLEVNRRLFSELENQGARLDALYYCAHHPTAGAAPYRVDCDCRKPKPGLIARAREDFEFDSSSSWIVGDRYSDIVLGHNAGLRSAFVLSGYGRGEWEYQRDTWTMKPDFICENLLEAVTQIIAEQKVPSLFATSNVEAAVE